MSTAQPLARITSLKVKLGLLVAASVTVAALVASLGRAGGVPVWLSIPVTIAARARRHPAAGRRHDVAAAADDRGRGADGDRRLRRPGHRHLERRGRRPGARVQHDGSRPVHGRPPAPRAGRERQPRAANAARRRCAPCSRTSSTASLPATRRRWRPLSTRPSAPAGWSRTSSTSPAWTRATHRCSPEPVPLGSLLADAVAEARVLGRAVEYDVRVDPADLVVSADPARLRQLVANLLDNASRHSPTGGTVAVTASRGRRPLPRRGARPGAGRRAVRPGAGLRALRDADRDRRAAAGTGLGLAIARWVTDLHGGSIRFVDPEPGREGARVRVALPLEPPDRPARPPGGDHARRTDACRVLARADAPVAVPAPPLLDGLFGELLAGARRAGPPLRPLVGALAVGVLGGAGAAVPRPRARHVPRAAGRGGVGARAASTPASTRSRLTCAGLCALLAATTAPARRGLDRGAVPAGRRRALRLRRDRSPYAARVRAVGAGLAGRRAPRAPVARTDADPADRARPRRRGAPHRGVVGGRRPRLRRPLRLGRRAPGHVVVDRAARPVARHLGGPRVPHGGRRRRGPRRRRTSPSTRRRSTRPRPRRDR